MLGILVIYLRKFFKKIQFCRHVAIKKQFDVCYYNCEAGRQHQSVGRIFSAVITAREKAVIAS